MNGCRVLMSNMSKKITYSRKNKENKKIYIDKLMYIYTTNWNWKFGHQL